mmetsp:Transcript_68980/g.194539  ORF Transcript_68980/g.194539 Transcript_68980/m.194539 type:complete len:470 (-) Transcript_68980:13-1422(-)
MSSDEGQQLVGGGGKGSRAQLNAAVVSTGWTKHHETETWNNKDEGEEEGLATPWGTIRSLINCFVSGGILGLAFQFVKTGSVTTMILLVFCGGVMYVTMMMLWDASVRAGTSGFMQTADKLWGKQVAKIVLVSLLIEQLGTVICYFNILRDTSPRVMQQIFLGCAEVTEGCEVPLYLQSWFIIAILTAFFVAPISCLSNPDVFSMISFVTWLHFGAFLVMMILEAVLATSKRDTFWPEEDGGPIRFGMATFSTTAIIGFAMAAHSTLLALLYGTKLPREDDAARKEIVKINGVSIVSVVVYYIVISVCFFLAFGTDVEANSLNSFPSDHMFSNIIRCTYTIEIGTSIPLFVYTIRRNVLISMFGLNGSQEALNKTEKDNRVLMIAMTVVILAVSAAMGLFLNLDIILGFSGAVAATLNAFILPAALFWTAEGQGPNPDGCMRKVGAPLIMFFGAVLGVVALADQVAGLV